MKNQINNTTSFPKNIIVQYILECFQMEMHGVKSTFNSYKMLAQTIYKMNFDIIFASKTKN